MPAGYGIKTDGHGQVDWAWVEQRLVAARNYWVCTTSANGRPHAMPVWGVWVDDALLFSTDPASTKGRNLDQRADVDIHLESGDEVVVLRGRAARMAPARYDAFVTAYDEKYGHRVDTTSPDFGLYQLEPERVLAWTEADFPVTATRFRRTLDA
jgi:pyridoxine/pyridoxamine 5'-phosphate oxidase